MKQKQSGFTLIEIAIVLVIIGLLLGGVLKGQELINSAKVKNLATDFKNIPVYIYGYQDKFRALPGDDIAVANHLGATTCVAPCAAGDGNGVLGNKSTTDVWTSTTATDETQQFWIHVRLAGLAAGPTSGVTDYRPTNSVGNVIGIQSGTNCTAAATPAASCTANFVTPIKDTNSNAIRGSYVICSTGILGKFVKQMDIQMDDGETDKGSMLATPTASYTMAATSTATADIDDAGSYTVCMGI